MLWCFTWPSLTVCFLDAGFVTSAILLLAVFGAVRRHHELVGPLVALSWLLVALVLSARFALVRAALISSLQPGGAEAVLLVALTRCVIQTLAVPMFLTIGVFVFLGLRAQASSRAGWGGLAVFAVIAALALVMTGWVMHSLWPYAKYSAPSAFP